MEHLTNEEKIIFDLRSLYERYGYSQYKMSKFEEYDLYARNKDFLMSDNIITFTDTNGKLMALKPDMTLSIVRNSRPSAQTVQKVYYNENVYRVSGSSRAFREIMQIGLECIGDIDDYCTAEVLLLAAKSLAQISPDSVLDISHLGIVSEMIDRMSVSEENKTALLKCIGEKNLHELTAICTSAGTDPEPLRRLVTASGTPEEVLNTLGELGCCESCIKELRDIVSVLRVNGLESIVRIDFSVVNAMSYYSGIVFRGYVSGVPSEVISGGRYDKLLTKMGKGCGAIGFAVYPHRLERLTSVNRKFDVDAVLLYSENTDAAAVCAAVKQLTDQGISVTAQKRVPDKMKYRQLMRLTESGVELLEQNA